jgi:hypothetical protein
LSLMQVCIFEISRKFLIFFLPILTPLKNSIY